MDKKAIDAIKKRFISHIKTHITNRYTCDDTTEILAIDKDLMLVVEVRASPSQEINPDVLSNYDRREYQLFIEEITPNTVGFRHNHAQFLRDNKHITETDYPSLFVHYRRFGGYRRQEYSPGRPTTAEYYNELFPQLGIKAKYDHDKGVKYAVVVFELINADDTLTYCGIHTKSTPDAAVNRICMRTIKRRRLSFGNSLGDLREQERWFSSYANSGISIQTRLEEKMRYFYTYRHFKEKIDAWNYASTIVERAKAGDFQELPRHSWRRPPQNQQDSYLPFFCATTQASSKTPPHQ